MTQPSQLAVMYERGFKVATASYVETVGPADAMTRVLEYLLDGTDALYVSIDIDVVNSSDAPATSAPGYRGISAPYSPSSATGYSTRSASSRRTSSRPCYSPHRSSACRRLSCHHDVVNSRGPGG
jgi:hypothetical protein